MVITLMTTPPHWRLYPIIREEKQADGKEQKSTIKG
jgi:hypothetical protein